MEQVIKEEAERALKLTRKLCKKYTENDIINETDVKRCFKYGLYKNDLKTMEKDIDLLIKKGFFIIIEKEYEVKRNRGRLFKIYPVVYKMLSLK